MARLSIIIPAFNEEAELPVTLQHLNDVRANLPLKSEIIVVDNNSSDETAKVALAHGAQVVFESVNQISKARNAGARSASGDCFIFVDADSRPPLETVQEAVSELGAGAIGGGSVLAFEGEVGWLARWMTWSWNRLACSVGLAAGCFVWVRADAFNQVGGFCEKRYAGEELILSRELKRLGRQSEQVFKILSRYPVLTSARKLAWYGAFTTAALHLLLAVFPFLLRSQAICRFWYRRPSEGRD
jgi:glycosyltransferase involved in cell wall biosynthesis|tara:strand:+ start:46449 stop:47177 length:729 start_codon:yes stop_codon:yes gene_type:complete